MLQKGSSGGLLAVSMSAPLSAPPADAGISSRERMVWMARTLRCNGSSKPAASAAAAAAREGEEEEEEEDVEGVGVEPTLPFRIAHWDGGPMQRDTPIAVAHVPNAERWAERLNLVSALPGGSDWIFGSYGAVAAVLSRVEEEEEEEEEEGEGRGKEEASTAAAAARKDRRRTLNCVWGCGGWGGTQVLAEIARGGWGIVTIDQVRWFGGRRFSPTGLPPPVDCCSPASVP